MVRLTPERKERWENMADEKGMSVPEIIRHAMEQLDSNGGGTTVENVEGINDVVETVEAVDGRTENIESQLSTLSTAIGELKQSIEGGETSAVEEQQVLEYIPEKGDCMRKQQSHSGISKDFDPEKTATPLDVAKKIDRENPPTDAVRRTLEQMALRSPRIEQVMFNDGQGQGFFIDV